MNKNVLIGTTVFLVLITVVAFAKMQGEQKKNIELSRQVEVLQERINALESQMKAKPLARPQVSRSAGMGQPGGRLVHGSWDPFAEMEAMQRDMYRMFDSFNHGFGVPQEDLFDPQMDIQQKGDQYVITIDIPGMQKDKINVEVKDKALIISGERAHEESKEGDGFYRQERSFGHFVRAIPLPEDAKTDNIEAQYENGVLVVKLSKIKVEPKQEQGGQKVTVK